MGHHLWVGIDTLCVCVCVCVCARAKRRKLLRLEERLEILYDSDWPEQEWHW